MQQNSSFDYLGRIHVGGADAEGFLQGQLTQDVRALEIGAPRYAGYCSPKGRLLAVMRMHRSGEGFELELHRGVLDATLKRLKMFVLRSKVSLDAAPAVASIDETSWRLQNIRGGVPVIYPGTSDHFVPQMVNLDLLGGIGFRKGCYTGQEIVARLHYLGNLKRRMFLLRAPGCGGASPAPGTPLLEAGHPQAVGEVVDSAADGADGLISAVLQIASAQGGDLRLQGAEGWQFATPLSYDYGANAPISPQ